MEKTISAETAPFAAQIIRQIKVRPKISQNTLQRLFCKAIQSSKEGLRIMSYCAEKR